MRRRGSHGLRVSVRWAAGRGFIADGMLRGAGAGAGRWGRVGREHGRPGRDSTSQRVGRRRGRGVVEEAEVDVERVHAPFSTRKGSGYSRAQRDQMVGVSSEPDDIAAARPLNQRERGRFYITA